MLAGILFAAVYTVYYFTMYSSIPGGDSGELVAESCHMGTPHPPGYPVHTLMSILFQQLPIPRVTVDAAAVAECSDFLGGALDWLVRGLHRGDNLHRKLDVSSCLTLTLFRLDLNPNVGWRINHMCCILGALAAVFIGLACGDVLQLRLKVLHYCHAGTVLGTPTPHFGQFLAPVVVATSLYAFSPLVWEYSVGSEVFALNNMFCALLIYLTVRVFHMAVDVHMMASSRAKVEQQLTSTTPSASTTAEKSAAASTSSAGDGGATGSEPRRGIPSSILGGSSAPPHASSLSHPHTPEDLISAHAALQQREMRLGNSITALVLVGALYSGLTLTNQHTSLLLVVVLVPFMLAVVTGSALAVGRWVPALVVSSMTDSHSASGTSSHAGLIASLNAAAGKQQHRSLELRKRTNAVMVLLLMLSTTLFLLGFIVPYSYLMLASAKPKQGSWGDMTNIGGLLRHVLRSEYGTFQLGGIQGREDMWARIWHYFRHVQAVATNHTGLPLGLLGVLWVFGSGGTPTNAIKDASSSGTDDSSKQKGSKDGGGSASKSAKKTPASTKGRGGGGSGNTRGLISSITYRTGVLPIASCLLLAWVAYLFLWHGILSNLPLDAPMPYAVHSRFWMQPDLLLMLFAGLGVAALQEGGNTIISLVVHGGGADARAGGVSSADGSGIASVVAAVNNAFNAYVVWLTWTHLVAARLLVMNRSDVQFDALFDPQQATMLGAGSPPGGLSMHSGSGKASPHAKAAAAVYESHVDLVNAVLGSSSLRDGDRERRSTRGENRFHGHSLISLYADALLDSLPHSALLASHTDLDWNAVRYMRFCEFEREEGDHPDPSGVHQKQRRRRRDDVDHVSFQLMPYPWFQKQQAPLYPAVKFPQPFAGISTSRLSEGNAQLVLRFLSMNADRIAHRATNISTSTSSSTVLSGGVYLDMQSISDVDLAEGGVWRGRYTMVPWGLLYRVENVLSLQDGAKFHRRSWKQLAQLRSRLPTVSPLFITKYPAGSWEFAVISVFHDAHYQFALNLLTYSIAAQKGATIPTLVMIVDRLLFASTVLLELQRNVLQFGGALTYSQEDLQKNTALSWLRLQGVVTILDQFSDTVLPLLLEPAPADAKPSKNKKGSSKNVSGTKMEPQLLNYNAVLELVQHISSTKTLWKEGEAEEEGASRSISGEHGSPHAALSVAGIQSTASSVIGSFVQLHPQDKDAAVFLKAVRAIEAAGKGEKGSD